MARAFALLALALWTALTLAGSPLPVSGVVSFNPPITGLKAGQHGQVLYRGTLTYTEGGFPAETFANAGNPTYWLSFGFGPNVPVPIAGQGATNQNVYIRAAGGLSLSGCPQISGWWNNDTQMVITWNTNVLPGNSASCSVTISVPIEITTLAGTPPGVVFGVDPAVPFTNAYSFGCVSTTKSDYTWAMRYKRTDCTTYYRPAVSGVVDTAITNLGCTLTATNTTVTLPTVSTSALQVSGSTAGSTPFQIRLQGCNNGSATPVSATGRWSFNRGTLGSHVIASGLTRLGVQLACAPSGTALSFTTGSPTLVSNGADVSMLFLPAGATNAVIVSDCRAQYIADGGPASPGQFSATATYTLTYN